ADKRANVVAAAAAAANALITMLNT
ncbi:hypothetical protein Tco_1499438, partial [Tanacetum coccineum]